MTTKEQVIQAAKEAGFNEPNPHDGYMGLAYEYRDGTDTGSSITVLYNLAYKAGEKAMQERAAKVCDELQAPPHVSDGDLSMWEVASMDCADAIRALEVSK